MSVDIRYDDDNGYEEGDDITPDRARWLEILERHGLPWDTWAAHMAWVYSSYSWDEAEAYAAKAHQMWEAFKAGRRADWVVRQGSRPQLLLFTGLGRLSG
jgi:hypothetical protein